MKKTLAILMTLLIVVTLIFPADAAENNDLTSVDMNPMEMTPIDMENPNEINDLTVRSTITRYFSERLAFLTGEATTISVASAAVFGDESLHRALIENGGITLLDSTVALNTVWCTDLYARVDLTETLTYSDDDSFQTESVHHKIKVSLTNEGTVIVTSDGYAVSHTGFSSAAYVPDDNNAYMPMVADGGRYCMRDIALLEENNGPHKYWTWYHGTPNYTEQLDWCAIFVCWCASQCNVSQTVIPESAKVGVLLDHFVSTSRFSLSDLTPTIGCIYFEGSSLDDYDHVGIIVNVSTDTIGIIEGNYENRVNYRTVSRTDPEYLGFGHPNYASNYHNIGSWLYNQSSHWHVCESCNLTVDSGSHTLGSWQIDTSEHWKKCSGCNVTFNLGNHSYGGWNYSSTYHWKACTSCGYKINHAAHTLGGWVHNSSQHWNTCSVCGYKANLGSHTYTAGVCSTCRYNPNISIDKLPDVERSPQ